MQVQKKKQMSLKREKESGDEIKVKKFLSKRKKDEEKKVKPKKRKRLIIRNLSFQISAEELREIFSKFGNVVDVNIPVKEDGRKRGFAFIEFSETRSLIKAMKALNQKEIHGRRVAIDFAIDKTSYQLKVQSVKQEKDASPDKETDQKSDVVSEDDSDEEKPDIDVLNESIDENEKRANDFLKEFDSGFETTQNEDESSSEAPTDDESENGDEDGSEDYSSSLDHEDKKLKITNRDKSSDSPKKNLCRERKSHDVSEGKTVFIRNVSFTTSKEDLREAVEKYGECEYCLICIDPLTDHSKGTAFVKFKSKESADKLVEESMKEPAGIVVDGRRLTCSPAVSKEVISQQKDENKKPKDKRNLYLLKYGLIMPNSPESEGVSPSDMSKRSQLEMLKKGKLKNVNFFVSDTRLLIHNIPKTFTDVKLRKLFKQVTGKGAIITEARVMRDFKKTSVDGTPLSKGFGFVTFKKHEDALKALTELNNNPNIFTSQKRPIVEFSVENRVALLSKERRKEKMKLRNKKRTEEKQERRNQKTVKDSSKKKRTEEKHSSKGKIHQRIVKDSSNKGKKKQKSQKSSDSASGKFSETNFKNRVNKYKEKLLNKV